jgi:hypothetical protein
MGQKVKHAGGAILHGPLKLQPHGEEVVIVADSDGELGPLRQPLSDCRTDLCLSATVALADRVRVLFCGRPGKLG